MLCAAGDLFSFAFKLPLFATLITFSFSSFFDTRFMRSEHLLENFFFIELLSISWLYHFLLASA